MPPKLLFSVLLLSLLAGCSGFGIGPHRIDVQQGNALDEESLARLKPGLSRSQVRFLLGTPLVVDPFRDNRWDYVYVFHKAGKLSEQKRVSLFFEGDTLSRIEGDMPVAQPVPEDSAASAARAVTAAPVAAEPAGIDTAPIAGSALKPETDVEKIKAEAGPESSRPGTPTSAGSDEAVLKVLHAWAAAWSQRDEDSYFAIYADDYAPQGGGSRAEWEKRRRLLMGLAKNIEVRIESPVVETAAGGAAVVTFNQYYRSDTYQDAVRKQLRLVERDGRWLIVEERVLSILRGKRS